MRIKVGDRVRVVEGSGLNSGRTGVVISWRGPRDEDSYKDEDPTTQVWVEYDDGGAASGRAAQGTMYIDRLIKI